MSKLIIDMEMPKSCDACPLLDESGDYPMCRATQETRGYNFDTVNKKMDKCPIKGILPDKHGRLIDADDVNNHIIGYVDLRGCPTIVEAAERKDDEQID